MTKSLQPKKTMPGVLAAETRIDISCHASQEEDLRLGSMIIIGWYYDSAFGTREDTFRSLAFGEDLHSEAERLSHEARCSF